MQVDVPRRGKVGNGIKVRRETRRIIYWLTKGRSPVFPFFSNRSSFSPDELNMWPARICCSGSQPTVLCVCAPLCCSLFKNIYIFVEKKKKPRFSSSRLFPNENSHLRNNNNVSCYFFSFLFSCYDGDTFGINYYANDTGWERLVGNLSLIVCL